MKDIHQILTDKEMKTRKQFIWLLFVFIGLEILTLFYHCYIFQKEGQKSEYLDAILTSGFSLGWLVLTYVFCWRKRTTLLLTLQIVGFFLATFWFGGYFLTELFSSDSLHGFSMLIVGTVIAIPMVWVFRTFLRFRATNKILRCYEFYPAESEEVFQLFRDLSDLSAIAIAFQEQMKKRPYLKSLINRECAFKNKELKALDS